MTIMDWILAAFLCWGAYRGWKRGLMHQIASVGGLILGFVVARMLYGMAAGYLAPHLGTSPTVAQIAAFILIWIAVPLALSVLAAILTRAFDMLCLGPVNRLAGAAVGVIKYGMVLSCLLYLIIHFQWMSRKETAGSILFEPVYTSGTMIFRVLKTGLQEIPYPDSLDLKGNLNCRNVLSGRDS